MTIGYGIELSSAKVHLNKHSSSAPDITITMHTHVSACFDNVYRTIIYQSSHQMRLLQKKLFDTARFRVATPMFACSTDHASSFALVKVKSGVSSVVYN